jgi:uncharacterized alkaline shock family protein YloU
MKIITQRGTITIMNDVFSVIAGYAAINCFGVKGMAVRTVSDGLVHLLRRESMSKGVKINYYEDGIVVDLHIVIEHGINIPAVTHSIMERVRYEVQRLTSIKVKAVNVFIDSMMKTS